LGELVKVMDRFGVQFYNPGKFFKGRRIEVTGKIRTFPARESDADPKPSYQLRISDWRKFRLLP
jgi:hypothetical protein